MLEPEGVEPDCIEETLGFLMNRDKEKFKLYADYYSYMIKVHKQKKIKY